MAQCVRVHPDNPKVFEFRGRPRVLVTATEHYGAVLNRPFDFPRYLADAAAKKMTLTRLFMLFRELQSAQNPYSTCKPESPEYVSPFARVGPGRALDGEPVYDLDRENPEFYERLHAFLSRASELGIVVEVVLLSNTYGDHIWALNPLHPRNNVNGLEDIHWAEYMTRRHARLYERQVAHVERIVRETNQYDNVVYEICNEPGGDLGTPGCPTCAEVDEWLSSLTEVVRRTEASLPNSHLVAGQQAFAYTPFTQGSEKAFGDFPVDVVNIHPLPNTTFDGVSYDQGTFMAKQLALGAVRDFCLATYAEPKPLNLDEDNAASQYKDPIGWTIHRKRAWTALMSGAHYDYIDFSVVPGLETGTDGSQRHIRTWMTHLSEYVHSVDLVRSRPAPEAVRALPAHTLASVLAVAGEDYSVYIADCREYGEPGAGGEIRGAVVCDLPEGAYEVACFSPRTGQYSPAVALAGGAGTSIALPAFTHDLVVRVRRSG